MVTARAEISIDFQDPDSARTAYGALLPEIEDSPSDRGQETLDMKGDVLNITIKGSDPGAFRAGINSYGRWLKLITGLMNKE